jgi:hypothetical protein
MLAPDRSPEATSLINPSRSCSARAGSAVVIAAEIRLNRTTPRAANPITIPVKRMVPEMPEAMPARSTGTTVIPTFVVSPFSKPAGLNVDVAARGGGEAAAPLPRITFQPSRCRSFGGRDLSADRRHGRRSAISSPGYLTTPPSGADFGPAIDSPPRRCTLRSNKNIYPFKG